jgi:hypothetical protein
MLSLSRTLRNELLEVPSAPLTAATAAAAPPRSKPKEATAAAAPAARKRRGVVVVAKAEELLFKQPESLLHRAVHAMFTYSKLNSYDTSLSAREASRRFAIYLPDVNQLIQQLRLDPKAEGHHAARRLLRVTVLTMLGAALNRKGGLVRIAKVFENRAKARARALQKLVSAVEEAIVAQFMPLVRQARLLLRDDAAHKRHAKQRLVDNYAALKHDVRLLRHACLAVRAEDDFHLDRSALCQRLSTAKMHARRLEGARTRLLARIASVAGAAAAAAAAAKA